MVSDRLWPRFTSATSRPSATASRTRRSSSSTSHVTAVGDDRPRLRRPADARPRARLPAGSVPGRFRSPRRPPGDADLPAGRPAGGMRAPGAGGRSRRATRPRYSRPAPGSWSCPCGILLLEARGASRAGRRRRDRQRVDERHQRPPRERRARRWDANDAYVVLAHLQRVADFSCALFNARRRDDRAGIVLPAHLGAIAHVVDFILDELDPSRSSRVTSCCTTIRTAADATAGAHPAAAGLPLRAARRVRRPVIGHMAEIGAVTVGSFASHGDRGLPGGPQVAARPSASSRGDSGSTTSGRSSSGTTARRATRGATCTR